MEAKYDWKNLSDVEVDYGIKKKTSADNVTTDLNQNLQVTV